MKVKDLIYKSLGNTEFSEEYCIPHAWYIVTLRKKAKITQKQLAEKCGTKQPSISRLEVEGEGTLRFVGKVAHALGYRAELKFTKLSKLKV